MTLCTCFTVLAARGLPSRPDRPLPVAPWCSSHRYRASRSSGGYFRDVLTPKRGCNVTRRVSVESGSAGLQAARSILEPGFKQIAEGVFAGCVMAASLNLGQKAREPCPSFKFACHVESASDAPGGSGGGIPARRYDNAPGISSPLEMAAAPGTASTRRSNSPFLDDVLWAYACRVLASVTELSLWPAPVFKEPGHAMGSLQATIDLDRAVARAHLPPLPHLTVRSALHLGPESTGKTVLHAPLPGYQGGYHHQRCRWRDLGNPGRKGLHEVKGP